MAEKEGKWFKVLETRDGKGISGFGKNYEEAKTYALQRLLIQGEVGPKGFEQGPVNELYPWSPGGELVPPEGASVIDITPSRIMGIGTGAPPIGMPEDSPYPMERGGELPPDAPMRWQDIVKILGPGANIEGGPGLPPQATPDMSLEEQRARYTSPGTTISTEQKRGMAAIQALTGATNFSDPGLFPGGPFETDSDLVRLGDEVYQEEIREELGRGNVDFNSTFPTTYVEDMAIYGRVGLTPPNRPQLAHILTQVIQPNYPEFETHITSDPGHPGNSFLWGRRAEGDPWEIIDLGFWDQMLSEGPSIVGAVIGSAVGKGTYATTLNRLFPFIKRGSKSLGSRIYRQLTEPGAAKSAGRMTATATGAAAGDAVEYELESLALSASENIPPPTWDQRKQEWGEMVAANALGEIAGTGLVSFGKTVFSPIKYRFGVAPNAFEAASSVQSIQGGPPLLPAMLTQVGRMKLARVWATSTGGRKDVIERSKAALAVFKKYADSLGDIYTLNTPGMSFGEAIESVSRINREMGDTLLGKSKLPIPRSYGEMMPDATDTLFRWQRNMGAFFDEFNIDIGNKFDALGASFDLSSLSSTIKKSIDGRARMTINTPAGPKRVPIGSFIVPDSDVHKALVTLNQLGDEVGGPGAYKSIQQLKTRVDYIDIGANEFENEILYRLKRGLYEALHNAKFIDETTGEASTARGLLDDFSKMYKGFKDTDRRFMASLMKTGSPSDVGRNLVDPFSSPELTTDLYLMYKASGDTAGWKELQGAYMEKLAGKDPDKLLTLLKQGGVDKDAKKALDLVLSKDMRENLAEYARIKSQLVGNNKIVELMSDVTNIGKQLTKAFDNNSAEYDTIIGLLQRNHPEDWRQMGAWSIIDNVINSSTTFADNGLVLDKNVIKRTLTDLKTKGIFDEFMTPRQLNEFENMLSYVEYLPSISGSDLATSLAGQELAAKALMFQTNPAAWVGGRIALLNNALNARYLLDGWFAGPVGMGRGRVTGPISKYTIGRMLVAANNVNEMGSRFKPGDYSSASAESLINDLTQANLILVSPSPPPTQGDYTSSQQIVEEQARIQNQRRLEYARSPVWDRISMQTDPMAASGQVPGPATGDFSQTELAIPEFLR